MAELTVRRLSEDNLNSACLNHVGQLKNPYIDGPAQFNPMLSKGQLYFRK